MLAAKDRRSSLPQAINQFKALTALIVRARQASLTSYSRCPGQGHHSKLFLQLEESCDSRITFTTSKTFKAENICFQRRAYQPNCQRSVFPAEMSREPLHAGSSNLSPRGYPVNPKLVLSNKAFELEVDRQVVRVDRTSMGTDSVCTDIAD